MVLANAIKKGYLHVDMPMTNKKTLSKAETLHVSLLSRCEYSADEGQLKILPPDRDPFTFKLTTSDVSGSVPHLLEATFEVSHEAKEMS